MSVAEVRSVEVEGLRLAYRERGEGPAVLLLHGWPTSSFLWRNVMQPIAASNRVIALDMPGFGASDKPLDASYGFGFHERALDGFLAGLGVDQVGLAVHDLGGPIGLYWAVRNPERLSRLAILNTLAYPEMSWAVKLFVLMCRTPGVSGWLTGPGGLRFSMKLGLADDSNLTDEVLAGVLEPFAEKPARRALAKAGYGLSVKRFAQIAPQLPSLKVPVRIVYGEEDRILPDVARTMARLEQDLPHAQLTSLPGCGHFLQEERPEEVGRLLAEFFAPE